VIISFFINDTGGNINNLPMTINKDLPLPQTPPPTIPFGESFLVYMIVGVIASIIVF